MRYVIGPLETCIAEFQAVHAETEQNRADSLNIVRANAENLRYLRTKRDRMGHDLDGLDEAVSNEGAVRPSGQTSVTGSPA